MRRTELEFFATDPAPSATIKPELMNDDQALTPTRTRTTLQRIARMLKGRYVPVPQSAVEIHFWSPASLPVELKETFQTGLLSN